jgi:hypothetical protein
MLSLQLQSGVLAAIALVLVLQQQQQTLLIELLLLCVLANVDVPPLRATDPLIICGDG